MQIRSNYSYLAEGAAIVAELYFYFLVCTFIRRTRMKSDNKISVFSLKKKEFFKNNYYGAPRHFVISNPIEWSIWTIALAKEIGSKKDDYNKWYVLCFYFNWYEDTTDTF